MNPRYEIKLSTSSTRNVLNSHQLRPQALQYGPKATNLKNHRKNKNHFEFRSHNTHRSGLEQKNGRGISQLLDEIRPRIYKVFVARIPGSITEQDLFTFFSPYGQIYDIRLDRRSNGKCSGSGNFTIDKKSGYKSICQSDHFFQERKIIATEFLDKKTMSKDSNAYHKRKVIVSKVPPFIQVSQIRDALEKFGPLENIFQVRVDNQKPSSHRLNRDLNSSEIEKNRTFQAIFKKFGDAKKLIFEEGILTVGGYSVKIRLFFKKFQAISNKNASLAKRQGQYGRLCYDPSMSQPNPNLYSSSSENEEYNSNDYQQTASQSSQKHTPFNSYNQDTYSGPLGNNRHTLPHLQRLENRGRVQTSQHHHRQMYNMGHFHLNKNQPQMNRHWSDIQTPQQSYCLDYYNRDGTMTPVESLRLELTSFRHQDLQIENHRVSNLRFNVIPAFWSN